MINVPKLLCTTYQLKEEINKINEQREQNSPLLVGNGIFSNSTSKHELSVEKQILRSRINELEQELEILRSKLTNSSVFWKEKDIVGLFFLFSCRCLTFFTGAKIFTIDRFENWKMFWRKRKLWNAHWSSEKIQSTFLTSMKIDRKMEKETLLEIVVDVDLLPRAFDWRRKPSRNEPRQVFHLLRQTKWVWKRSFTKLVENKVFSTDEILYERNTKFLSRNCCRRRRFRKAHETIKLNFTLYKFRFVFFVVRAIDKFRFRAFRRTERKLCTQINRCSAEIETFIRKKQAKSQRKSCLLFATFVQTLNDPRTSIHQRRRSS